MTYKRMIVFNVVTDLELYSAFHIYEWKIERKFIAIISLLDIIHRPVFFI
jgi:hypothetical protein